ncbi:MAG: tetratricopeptide repeat protein [Bacteroidota bacterium]
MNKKQTNTDHTILPKDTIQQLIRYAKLEKPEIYHLLGTWYLEGKHVKKNLKRAISFFKKAADEDVIEAVYQLALHHQSGIGTPQDAQEAHRLFTKAALNGHPPSAQKVADIYASKPKTKKNKKLATLWAQYAKGTLIPIPL